MSMRDILGKLARIDESMKSDAKKPTGPKFPGYWKGTDKASQAKNKMVGGAAEESIIKDLERALTESPSRDLKEEYKRYNSEWCQVCGQSPCNCTTINEDSYVLYVNGKPASKYAKLEQATQDVALLKNRVPSAKVEIKQEVCKMEPVGISESFIAALEANTPDAMTPHDEALIKHVLHLAAFYMQSENLKGMFSLEDYVYKKMGIQPALNEAFNSKQEVIDHFVRQGKPAAAGAAAWERGWRGPKQQSKPTKAPQAPQQKYWWQDREELEEYGGVGGYGAASQAPAGTTDQETDPAAQQMKLDQAQIKKSTDNIATTLNQQSAAQPVNKTKFSDVLTKLDAEPNTNLSAQELQQMTPMAVAASKALQNPQTAGQMKQLISKSDTLDKQKQLKVQQAQQQIGTNQPQSTTTTPPSAGQTK